MNYIKMAETARIEKPPTIARARFHLILQLIENQSLAKFNRLKMAILDMFWQRLATDRKGAEKECVFVNLCVSFAHESFIYKGIREGFAVLCELSGKMYSVLDRLRLTVLSLCFPALRSSYIGGCFMSKKAIFGHLNYEKLCETLYPPCSLR